MTQPHQDPQEPQNGGEAQDAPPPEVHVIPSPEPPVNIEPDDEIGADRTGSGSAGRPDPDIPPGVRTMRNLRDRHRVIE